MRIKNIDIKNFGRLGSLTAKDLGYCVGLLGPNGSGKSTFLKAVEFGFQGKVESPKGENEPLNSYIRNFGTPHAAKSAEITMDFEIHGREGVLYRKITGTTTSRELAWDGKTLTKASDVEDALDVIFGARRKALAQTAFLRQGTLDKTLFGSAAEREKHYTWLFRIEHLLRVVEEADRIANLTKFTISDSVGASIDTLRVELESHRRRVKEHENILITCRSYSPQLDSLKRIRQMDSELQRRDSDGMELRAVSDRLQGAFRQTLLECSNQLGITIQEASPEADVAVKLQGFESELSECRQKHTRAALAGPVIQRWTEHAGKKADAQKSAVELTMELARIVSYRDIDVRALSTEEGAIVRYGDALLAFQRATNLQVSAQQGLDSLVPPEPVTDQMLGDRDRILAEGKTHGDRVAQLTGILTALERCDHSSECPVCHSTLNGDVVAVLKADKERETQLLDQARKNWAAINERVKTLQDAFAKYQTDTATARANLARSTEALAAAKSQLEALGGKPQRTLQEVQAAIADASEKIAKLRDVESKLEGVRNFIQSMGDMQEPAAEIAEYQTAENAGKVASDLTIEMQRLEASISRCHRVNRELVDGLNRVRDNNAKMEEHTRSTDGRKEERSAAFAALPEDIKDVVATSGNLDAAILEVERRHQPYVEALGGVDTARSIMDATAARIDTLEQQQASENGKRKALEGLATIKRVFSRTGIPQAYIRKQFERLSVLVQDNLSHMMADFEIRVSEEDPTSFDFSRTDGLDVWFPQTKLSGGQRVRLTTSFAIAAQQLILRDFGFLTLDEPSMHLDTEGAESLRDMLVSIGARLRNTGTQCIVADHHEAIVPAFDSIIRIK